jgi:hypothetical protein
VWSIRPPIRGEGRSPAILPSGHRRVERISQKVVTPT